VKAVAYIRVSDPSQVEGHSLDAQERLFRELCRSRGWEVIRIYREEGRSAHVDAIARRPIFRQLLEDSAKGQFDVVVVHMLDRWSRKLRVTLESLSILGRNKVGLVSITESLDYSRPEGMLFLQMLGAFAEYYSGALGAHVKKGQEQRAHEGKHLGGIPFGYQSCWSEISE
jgi:site-specific DNA recombinase